MSSDLESLLATNFAEPIDLTIVNPILALPPFVAAPGLFNARDLADGTQISLKTNYIFRSGSLEQLTDEGQNALVSLGIKDIFDLRSLKERTSLPEPNVPGIENHWSPSTVDNTTTVESQQRDKTPFTFKTMYIDMLISHQTSFKSIFEHIRDHPDRPFLFHCTAGKDRTGVAAALILGLAGEPLEYINRDYALTRLGIEPVRELLLSKLTNGNPEVLKSPNMQMYTQSTPHVWTDIFAEMQEQYGGVQNYVKTKLGFTDAELETIRTNLRA